MSTQCRACASDDVERIEALGREAMAGAMSWRAAAREAGMRSESLRNHMENHVVDDVVAQVESVMTEAMDALTVEARDGLREMFDYVPADVKPLLLVAMHNLEGLRRTKPSQEALIKALKTVQEVTGMKNEQRMLLAFAKAMFGEKGAPIPKERIESVVEVLAELPEAEVADDDDGDR